MWDVRATLHFVCNRGPTGAHNTCRVIVALPPKRRRVQRLDVHGVRLRVISRDALRSDSTVGERLAASFVYPHMDGRRET
jgi:hypothetical protein